MSRSPHYPLVPKALRANLEFRANLVSQAMDDKQLAEELWIMCARDLLFFCNVFVWLYEPRRKIHLPFVTYGFQDESLLEIDTAIGNHDLVIEKSRDMGGTYMVLVVFLWRFLFHPDYTFLVVSRKETLVDKLGDSDTLFEKLRQIIARLPGWLRPKIDDKLLSLVNNDNGSTIHGDSTTDDVSRGGRRTAIFFDEFAAVDPSAQSQIVDASGAVTDSRIFASTPKGAGNQFYKMTVNPEILKLTLHWSRHPRKCRGLYRVDGGKYVRLDDYRGPVQVLEGGRQKTVLFPDDYQFVLDGEQSARFGHVRSPWYDNECKRERNRMRMAQEHDIDYLGSAYQFFDSSVLFALERDTVRRGLASGLLTIDREPCRPQRFQELQNGPLTLWCNIDATGSPPAGWYTIGADIATGTTDSSGAGSSNSALAVIDNATREKVAEFAVSGVKPEEFARYAISFCRWFADHAGEPAFLIWEGNGPGGIFGNFVVEHGFRNFYYRRAEDTIARDSTEKPGWWTTVETKKVLLGRLRQALADGTYIERSELCVDEMRRYNEQPGGQIYHAEAMSTDDPTGARDNHGDRVIATALAVFGSGLRGTVDVEEPVEIPYGCRAWRDREFEKAAVAAGRW